MKIKPSIGLIILGSLSLSMAVQASQTKSSPPAPTPTEKSEAVKNNTAAKNNDTESEKAAAQPQPIIVQIMPARKTKEEIDADTKRENDHAANDRETTRLTRYLVIVGIGQGVLFFLQLLVFGYQAYELRRTITKQDEASSRQTRDMRDSINEATRAATSMASFADSAAKSATAAVEQTNYLRRQSNALDNQVTALQQQARLIKASIATERPHIFVYGANEIVAQGWEGEESYIVKYKVANFGRVPGIVTTVRIGVIGAGENPELPEVDNRHTLKRDYIFSIGEIRDEAFYFPFDDIPLKGEFSPDGDGYIWDYYIPTTDEEIRLMVAIYYEGPTTRGHRTITTWVFSKSAGRFIMYESEQGYEIYNRMD